MRDDNRGGNDIHLVLVTRFPNAPKKLNKDRSQVLNLKSKSSLKQGRF